MSIPQQQVVTLLENVLFETSTQATANAVKWNAGPAATDISSLAAAMAASPEEGIAAHIVGYYLASLGRAPTAAEIQFYVSYAERGLTPAQIAADQVPASTWSSISSFFTASPEFAARAGIDTSLGMTAALLEVVPWLYQSVLGRAPSVAEISFYDTQITSGAGLNTLFGEFTASPEFATDTGAQIAAALAAYGTAVASGIDPATIGGSVTLGPPAPPPAPAAAPPPIPAAIAFTTGADHFNALGSTTVYSAVLGTGATLNSGDSLAGAGNTLTLADTSGGLDLMPAATLTDIPIVTLTTTGDAGTGSATPFDLSGVTGLTHLTVTATGGGNDYIKVGSGVVLTVDSASGTVGVVSTGTASLSLTDANLSSLQLTGNVSVGSAALPLVIGVDSAAISGTSDDAAIYVSFHQNGLNSSVSGGAGGAAAIADVRLGNGDDSITLLGLGGRGSSGAQASSAGAPAFGGTGGAGGDSGGQDFHGVALGNGNNTVLIEVNGGVGGIGGNAYGVGFDATGGTGGAGGNGGHEVIMLGDGNNIITDDSTGNPGGAGGDGSSGTGTANATGGVGGAGGNGGHNAITAGNGDNVITDNSIGVHGGAGGNAYGNGTGVSTGGRGGAGGNGGSDTITVGNGNNIITDNSSSGAGGSAGFAYAGASNTPGATGADGTSGNDVITVGWGNNTIDLGHHGNDTVILGVDHAYVAGTTTANQIIKNSAAGDDIRFSGNTSGSETVSYDAGATSLTTLEADVASNFGGTGGGHDLVAGGRWGGNTYIVYSATPTLDSTQTTVVEIVGAVYTFFSYDTTGTGIVLHP